MGTFNQGRTNQILSLTPSATGTTLGGASVGNPSGSALPSAEALSLLPALPQIAQELETYFSIARQIEAAFLQEKANTRKYREELRDLQQRYSRFSSEAEAKNRDYANREERLKVQSAASQQSEKNLRNEVQELARQMDLLQEEKKRIELGSELLKANLESFKNREESLKGSLRILQANEKARTDREERFRKEQSEREERFKKEFQTLQSELSQYKAVWTKVATVDQKAKSMFRDFEDAKKKVEDLTEFLAHEKKRREDQEELVKKEKREKQLALTCLHTAEAQLAQVTREVEELRGHVGQNFEGQSIELKF